MVAVIAASVFPLLVSLSVFSRSAEAFLVKGRHEIGGLMVVGGKTQTGDSDQSCSGKDMAWIFENVLKRHRDGTELVE